MESKFHFTIVTDIIQNENFFNPLKLFKILTKLEKERNKLFLVLMIAVVT